MAFGCGVVVSSFLAALAFFLFLASLPLPGSASLAWPFSGAPLQENKSDASDRGNTKKARK